MLWLKDEESRTFLYSAFEENVGCLHGDAMLNADGTRWPREPPTR